MHDWEGKYEEGSTSFDELLRPESYTPSTSTLWGSYTPYIPITPPLVPPNLLASLNLDDADVVNEVCIYFPLYLIYI